MPTYDYECDACGYEWELFQKITDDPEKKCPDCNKKKARRLFGTGAAIMFKGSGFYETDYRSDSYKKGADKANKKSETAAGDSKSTDVKSNNGSATSEASASTTKAVESKSVSKPASKKKE